ncbi:C39 family peptidase [Candidatus Poribacteria bacterium]|nr:C39 family peptidase [Candidatus Poribacteria bacterium]
MYRNVLILAFLALMIFPLIGCEMTYNKLKADLTAKPVDMSNGKVEKEVSAEIPSLPQKFTLPVPHNPARQYGPDCGPDSLRMVLNYYGKGVREGDIVRQLKSRGKYGGVTLSQLARIARGYDLEAYIMAGLNLEILKALLVNKWPPIVTYRARRDVGHAVVVVGYDDTKKRLMVNDPNFVRVSRIPYHDFIPAWQQFGGSCLLVVPKGIKQSDILAAIRRYVSFEIR